MVQLRSGRAATASANDALTATKIRDPFCSLRSLLGSYTAELDFERNHLVRALRFFLWFVGKVDVGMRSCKPRSRIASANKDAGKTPVRCGNSRIDIELR